MVGFLVKETVAQGNGRSYRQKISINVMRKETKIENRFNKTRAWTWTAVTIIVGTTVVYGAVEYSTVSARMGEAEQLAKNGQYSAAATDLASIQNDLVGNVLFAQRINADLALNNLQQQNQSLQQQNRTQAQVAEEQQQAIQNKASNQQSVAQLLSMMGKTLNGYYNEVRSARNIGSLVCLYGTQCEVNFWAELAQQALGEDSLRAIFPEQKYEATYHSYTGSYTYLDAKKQLDELVFAPYAAGVNNTDSDAIKIGKILNFIDSNIHYEYDMSETPQAPAETLAQKSGDCKDFSILASAALADAGINSAVMSVRNLSGDGHAMVLVQSNENPPLYGAYQDLTKYGLPGGKWYVIEPQYTFAEQQQHPDWFAQWSIRKAAWVGN